MARSVAVIGAGSSGIAAGRRLKEDGHDFDIYEQSSCLGGTWVYDDRTGDNEYGLPIHTSMYQNLRTNLPKEVMCYPGYPISDPTELSYVSAEVILDYLKDCAVSFGIMSKIQFNTYVFKIERKENYWMVRSRNLKTDEVQEKNYDAVMVCNGHYHTPHIPKIPGYETFKGTSMHSHDYRKPDRFKNLRVVVVGAGPSGLDIARETAAHATTVYLSHYMRDIITATLPPNLIVKPELIKLEGNVAHFKDGSSVEVDLIHYCTGYLYNFPFLDESCGIKVCHNHVKPLYKHLISINHPTLCFVGLPFYVCANSMFDLQVRFFLATLNGNFQLPPKEELIEDEIRDMKRRRSLGYGSRESHKMGDIQSDYYEDLANTASITGLPSYMAKLHCESSRRFLEDVDNFRKDRYRIIDENTYEAIE